jgi:hypothetical protein
MQVPGTRGSIGFSIFAGKGYAFVTTIVNV